MLVSGMIRSSVSLRMAAERVQPAPAVKIRDHFGERIGKRTRSDDAILRRSSWKVATISIVRVIFRVFSTDD